MTSPTKRRFFFLGRPRKGVALVLVLAFVVLLASIIVAFFSRVQNEQQISRSSANQARVKLLADGAVDTIVGNVKQEIVTGSTTSTPAPGVTTYTPKLPKNMVPEIDSDLQGQTGLENLIKVSKISGGRATNDASESRQIDLKRWNKPLFVTPTSNTDYTPVTSFPTVPQWIYLQRNGNQVGTPNASASTNTNDPTAVVGRYAYAVYDEGGLLDVNIAGYPDALNSGNMSNGAMYRKIGMSYVNLRDLKNPSTNTSFFTQGEAKLLTDWRDYATGQSVNSPSLSTKEGMYATAVFSNRTGFLQTASAGQAGLPGGQTDRKFVGRQQLIDFVVNKLNSTGTLNALKYLTTFSRDLNQPSYIHAIQSDPVNAPQVLSPTLGGNSSTYKSDKLINPNFLSTRVQRVFTRNDGTQANPGDPLVNKRFPLMRLAWVTYLGPSANRSQGDPDIQALINNGIPWVYLQQGTDQNIEKYFGLRWDKPNNRWLYNVHNGGGSGSGAIMKVGRPSGTGADPSTYVQDANRDPDFFELLKAGISVGSLGKTAWTPTPASVNTQNPTPIDNTLPRESNGGNVSFPVVPSAYSATDVPVNVRYKLDSSVDYQIIQIGANIINETSPASYPIRIGFNDGGARGIWDILGVTDIPYLGYVFNGMLKTAPAMSTPAKNFTQTDDGNTRQYPIRSGESLTNPGNAYVIQVPAVWNPYDPNGARGVARPTQFRVIVDSNDPVTLRTDGSSSNKGIYCAAVATGSTQTSGGNAGYLPGHGPEVFSYKVQPGAPKYGTSITGSPVHDVVDFQGDAAGLLFRDPTLIISKAVGNATRETSNTTPVTLPNITSVVESSLPNGQTVSSWAPLILGKIPLAFIDDVDYPATPNTVWTGTAVIGPGLANPSQATGDYRVYFTYTLQYQDSRGQWVTYDTKYGRTTHGRFSFQTNGNSSNSVITGGPDAFCPSSWAAAIDPRSARFGLMMTAQDARRSGTYYSWPPPGSAWSYNASGSASSTACISLPVRPDQNGGFTLSNIDSYDQINIWPINGGSYPANRNGCFNVGTTLMADVPFPTFSAGWTRSTNIATGNGQNAPTPVFAPGMYAQNNPNVPLYPMRYNGADNPPASFDTIASPAYYADADGVIRRAGGAYARAGNVGMSASSPIGLPTASIYGFQGSDTSTLKTPATAPGSFVQAQSRPLLLHRPFRSVAELGYVFRDDPWKNLSFFTPESGDAALLDLFCINEVDNANALVAGKVNLNTRQAPVLGAIVNGAYIDDPKAGTDPTVGSISPNSNLGSKIATALVTRTMDFANYGPLQNISELVGKWKTKRAVNPGVSYNPTPGANANVDLPLNNGNGYMDGQTSYIGFSGGASNAAASGNPKDLSDAIAAASLPTQLKSSLSQIQRFREAPIRALASAGQTRVWNLMIDVVAQAGRMPQSASRFTVEGEQRYWVHVAIDRLTGEVIDKQVEVVKE